MTESDILRQRLLDCICDGLKEITADDLTDNGRIAIDPSHAPNGKQSAIGSFFRQMGEEGILERTGRVVRSAAPKRKGGLIQVWAVTEYGAQWARRSRRRLIRRPSPR